MTENQGKTDLLKKNRKLYNYNIQSVLRLRAVHIYIDHMTESFNRKMGDDEIDKRNNFQVKKIKPIFGNLDLFFG